MHACTLAPRTMAALLATVSATRRVAYATQERKQALCYVFVYIFCLQVITTNTRTSTLWKLNAEQGKIVSVSTGRHAARDSLAGFTLEDGDFLHPDELDEDEESTFTIITATAANSRHNTWNRGEGTTEELLRRLGEDTANHAPSQTTNGSSEDTVLTSSKGNTDDYTSQPDKRSSAEPLTCGKPVNFTHYDDLVGVAQRYEHNLAPEPEVAYLFLKRKSGQSLDHFNIDALERRLRRAKKEQPQTIQLWNQIGNFWRIKGNAGHAIECFRRALSVAPTNADTLLNLARVLFNLQYLDDAISLTKRSLEVHPADRSAWRQYFTLGEIFKAYGQLSDSILHLKQALALYPHYEPIRRLIAEAEKIEFASNTTRMQFYTGLIIVMLSLFVLLMVSLMLRSRSSGSGFFSSPSYFSSNGGCKEEPAANDPNDDSRLGPIINGFSLASFRPAKHFNRAQAMRSLRSVAFRSFRPFRYRK
ncbi:tetratricopeptide repeat protein 17-like [Toxorhynchites rutilus septentrionalis]|uniref:tetratricopeptide repeat protein 17-like n=1 Tax=Toxorhynchites rutilus septentrionalis TaxID=329112 RepID=UPI0024786CFB|nr:tetratricopeptide repeat protein 17-like [Toxorhynchites rutilus septentrionalis]